MHLAPLTAGLLFLAIVLLDAFQTIILPRRPTVRFRITRMFFIATWTPWTLFARVIPSRRAREQFYSIYGPLSLLLLIVVWAVLLVTAYGLIFYGAGTPFNDPLHPVTALARLRTCLYASGTTIFTLGLGDVTPYSPLARILVIVEAGTGLGFVALVIGYVPVLYTAFSHREVSVAMLDARAGSPPTAGELLLRHNFNGGHHALTTLLAEWERWSAEMLESHVSYPILCYYRSQHDNQSWLSAITAILDTCALLITTVEGPSTRQAQLTFAMARHTLVDLGHVFHRDAEIQALLAQSKATAPGGPSFAVSSQRVGSAAATDRLPPDEYSRLCTALAAAGFSLCGADDTRDRLAAIRQLYEPQATALGHYLHLDLPLWLPAAKDPNHKPDQWTTVSQLRNRAATFDRISSESAASALHDITSHPL